MSDVKQLAESLLVSLKAFVDRRAAELRDHFSGELAKVQAKAGPAGEPGADGPQGPQGPTGAQGEPGARGDVGAAGAIGEPGVIGPDGPRGADGAAGPQGLPGARGDTGPQGGDGPAGPQGDAGPAGSIGTQGRDGQDGAAGAIGAQGLAGRDGAAGEPGADAYTLAVRAGFVGTALAWLESLRGANGREGTDGRDGRDGKDGEHGRDAAEIEPLNGIDAEKSYARGTWAKNDGGLWLARRKTKGMDGWDCVVVGLNKVVTASDGLRNFGFALRLSDGTTVEQSWKIPFMIHQGVFLHDRTYDHGDAVTYGGSIWCALRDIPRGNPGDIEGEWKLICKKGRDGKDAGK